MHAFLKCSNMREISIEGDLDKVAMCVFNHCKSLRTLALPPTVLSIQADSCRQCFSLVDVFFPERLETIEEQSFQECRSLRAVLIPSNVGLIDHSAFKGCTSLVSVLYFPNSANIYIGRSAFEGCQSLCHVHFNILAANAVRQDVFEGCTTLEKRYGKPACMGGVTLKKSLSLCSRASVDDEITMGKLNEIFEATSIIEDIVDDFGMTPFHTLACVPQLRIDLFQGLLDRLPPSIIMQKDRQGKTAMDYLLMHEMQDATPLIKHILRETVLARVNLWGAARLKETFASKIAGINFSLGMKETRDKVQAICVQMKSAETKEAITILELAVWKAKIQSLNSLPKRPRLDRFSCLANCRSSVLIPKVLCFVGDFGINPQHE